jgi:hypothetical protein
MLPMAWPMDEPTATPLMNIFSKLSWAYINDDIERLTLQYWPSDQKGQGLVTVVVAPAGFAVEQVDEQLWMLGAFEELESKLELWQEPQLDDEEPHHRVNEAWLLY